MQDISPLSRDTENALNELGRIFDKISIADDMGQMLKKVFLKIRPTERCRANEYDLDKA